MAKEERAAWFVIGGGCSKSRLEFIGGATRRQHARKGRNDNRPGHFRSGPAGKTLPP